MSKPSAIERELSLLTALTSNFSAWAGVGLVSMSKTVLYMHYTNILISIQVICDSVNSVWLSHKSLVYTVTISYFFRTFVFLKGITSASSSVSQLSFDEIVIGEHCIDIRLKCFLKVWPHAIEQFSSGCAIHQYETSIDVQLFGISS